MEVFMMALLFVAGFCFGKFSRLFDPKKFSQKISLSSYESQDVCLKLKAFVSEIYDQYSRKTRPSRFSVSVTNLSSRPVELLGWFMRFKTPGSEVTRKLEFRPQNLTSSLAAGERFTIEVSDLEVFKDRELEDIVVRAMPGGEFSLDEAELDKVSTEIETILESMDEKDFRN